jgi:DNA polymerase elongation subunit (family B)
MISENISHNTIILDADYLGEEGASRLRERGIEFEDVSYDNFVYVKKGKQTKKIPNVEKPVVTCRYVQPKRDENGNIIDSERGIIPKILMKLLKARKDTRKRIETEKDPFKRSVLDGLQLAYKVTANSIYGSIGASVNPIYFKDIAASTTAVGRRMLTTAKAFIEQNYEGSEIVYGDTDSIFINFHPKDENGMPLEGEVALQRSIEMGEEASERIRSILRKPHCLEYEKTFYPFILFTKKRYVGNKYTTDIKKFVLASMGIVLKRRDNAPILKYVYGQIINIILNKKNILESIEFLRNLLYRIISNEFPLNYFVITKCLKSQYKTPDKIVHKVLADRIAERDPGNKPQSNDRIPYVYVDLGAKEAKLQGDRVEHPEYIKQHNLKIDYLFYITNQISKPVCQIYSLVLEQLPGYMKPLNYYKKIETALAEAGIEESKIKKKLGDMRVAEAHEVLLKPIINEEIKRHAEEYSIVLGVKKEIKRKQLKVLNVVVEKYELPEAEKKPRKRASPKKEKVESSEECIVLEEKVKINRKTKQVVAK